MSLLFESGQTILFQGDSITDCGRREDSVGIGHGYMRFASQMLIAKYPELGLTFINRGISGNTVLDLRQRWQADVIDLEPDWMSVMIGINDTSRFVNGVIPELTAEVYEATYRELLTEAVEETGVKLILIEPFMVDLGMEEPRRGELNRRLEIVHRLAGEFDAILVKVDEAFRAASEPRGKDVFWNPNGEPVHPNAAGHALIALQYLEAVNW